MILSAQTAAYLTAVNLAAIGCGLLIRCLRGYEPSLLQWGLGLLLCASAQGLDAQLLVLPLPSGRVAGSVLLSAGYCLIYLGMHRVLCGAVTPAMRALLAAIPCLPMLTPGLEGDELALQRFDLLTRACLCGVVVLQLWRYRARLSRFAFLMLLCGVLQVGDYVLLVQGLVFGCDDGALPLSGSWSASAYLRMALGILAASMGLLAMHNDRLCERLACAANTDELTGLHNRRRFNELGQYALRENSRGHQGLWMLMVDIDHFKEINDRFGHVEGDRILQQVSRVLSQSLRGGDIIARYGGEEFSILLPDTGMSSARNIAQRLLGQVATLRAGPQADHPVTISIGAALCPVDQSDLNGLVDRADKALYQSKANGRNCIMGLS